MVFPYLKGLVIIKCGFFYLALWIYCVFSICGYYIGRSIQVLNTLTAIEIPVATVLGMTLLPYGGGLESPPLGNVLEAFPTNPMRCRNVGLVPPVKFMCSSA
jgi:hypothetical protein